MNQNDAMMAALDQAYAVDDEMQKDIEMGKADPLALLPAKDGFVPKELVPWATDPDGRFFDEVPEEHQDEAQRNYEAGMRDRWVNRERVKISGTGISPLTNRDTQVAEGLIAFIEFEVTGGPNKGKSVTQKWFVKNTEPKTARDMNADLQEVFGKFKIEPELVELQRPVRDPADNMPMTDDDGEVIMETVEGRSYTASLGNGKLLNKQVELPVQQKWDYRYVMLANGSFDAIVDEPKQFKKKVLFSSLKVL